MVTTPAVPVSRTPTRELTIEQIYRRDAPGVVQITATSKQTQQALGSGFVIDKAGHIVTNYHVIAGAQRVQVSFSSQDEIDATVVGRDPSTDLAVLKIDTHARALTPLSLGNSDAVRTGDPVYAIGNPFGFARTLTSGIVSAVQRQIFAPNSLAIDHAIQTDAAINHGNSGGPLIDGAGRVIGVTSQISTGNTGQEGSVGIGFAIPINTVRNVAGQIVRTGKVEHAYLGIQVQPVTDQLAKLFNLPTHHGLLVEKVDPSTGAANAGIKAGSTPVVVQGQSYRLGGDLIVAVGSSPVSTYEQLRDAVASKKPGDSLRLEIYRGGKKQSVTVKLGQAPR